MSSTTDLNDDALPPVCRRTMEKLQGVMDGELPEHELDHFDHASTCSLCRERIATAKLLFNVLKVRNEERNDTPLDPARTDSIVSAVLADRAVERRSRLRGRVFALAGSLAIAAGLLFALWLRWPGTPDQPNQVQPQPEMVKSPQAATDPEVAPAPHAVSAPRPVRLGDEFARAEQAFLGSSRPITEPAQVAPQVLFKLTDVLTQPSEPTPEFEPARKSLLDLPDAARNGLQPVTATTQKAFARLLHDVSAVQVTAGPN